MDGGNTWTDVTGGTGGTGLNYTPPALTQTTKYRLGVRGGLTSCNIVYSNTVTVTVNDPSVSASDTALCTGLIRELFPYTGGYWTSSAPNIAEISSNNIFVTGKSAGMASLTFTDTVGGGCSASIVVEVRDFPEVSETTGARVVCKDQTIVLANPTTLDSGQKGSWRKNNNNIEFISPTSNDVTIKGKTIGKAYVSYTVSDGICETTTTFRIKVIPDTPPEIKIGFEK
jgi:hypothetical protein